MPDILTTVLNILTTILSHLTAALGIVFAVLLLAALVRVLHNRYEARPEVKERRYQDFISSPGWREYEQERDEANRRRHERALAEEAKVDVWQAFAALEAYLASQRKARQKSDSPIC